MSIFELKINNIPLDKASEDFKERLNKEFNLQNALVLHFQQKDNKKVLLLRLDNEEKHKELQSKKLAYNEFEVEFSHYERPGIKWINDLLERRRLRPKNAASVEDQEAQFSKVYLSNVPKFMTKEGLLKRMGRFGKIKSLDIIGGDNQKPQKKKQKCSFAVIHYKKFEDAVKVFYKDKIKIGKKKLKVKLFMEEKASKYKKDEIEKKGHTREGDSRLESMIGNFNKQITEAGKDSPPHPKKRDIVNKEEEKISIRAIKGEKKKKISKERRVVLKEQETFKFRGELALPILEENHYLRNVRFRKDWGGYSLRKRREEVQERRAQNFLWNPRY